MISESYWFASFTLNATYWQFLRHITYICIVYSVSSVIIYSCGVGGVTFGPLSNVVKIKSCYFKWLNSSKTIFSTIFFLSQMTVSLNYNSDFIFFFWLKINTRGNTDHICIIPSRRIESVVRSVQCLKISTPCQVIYYTLKTNKRKNLETKIPVMNLRS